MLTRDGECNTVVPQPIRDRGCGLTRRWLQLEREEDGTVECDPGRAMPPILLEVALHEWETEKLEVERLCALQVTHEHRKVVYAAYRRFGHRTG